MDDQKKQEPSEKVEKKDEVSDVLDSVAGAVKDRLRSHFLGGFILTWLAFHWQAIYVILFVDPLEMPNEYKQVCYPDKVSYVRDLPYTCWEDLIWPVVVALLLPPLAHAVDELAIKPLKQWGSNTSIKVRGWFVNEPVYSQVDYDEVTKWLKVARKDLQDEKNAKQFAEDQVDSLRDLLKATKKEKNEEQATNERELRDALVQLASARDGAENLNRELKQSKEEYDKLRSSYSEVANQFVSTQRELADVRKELKDGENMVTRCQSIESLVVNQIPIAVDAISPIVHAQQIPALTRALKLFQELLLAYHGKPENK